MHEAQVQNEAEATPRRGFPVRLGAALSAAAFRQGDDIAHLAEDKAFGVHEPSIRRRIAVCVDDFGLHGGVNDAALRLLALGRVSALSAMTQAPAWINGAAAARELDPSRVDIGLHFNLTADFDGASAMASLPTLVAAAHMRALPLAHVREALFRQFDAFERAMQRAPSHLDGYQHVHQLPQVRDLILEACVQHYGRATLPWLRACTAPRRPDGPVLFQRAWRKARAIEHLGSKGLRRKASLLGFKLNGNLLGVYDIGWRCAEVYGPLLEHWLRTAQTGDLLMCHPGSARFDDPQSYARSTELAVLAAPGLGELLSHLHVEIVPLSSLD